MSDSQCFIFVSPEKIDETNLDQDFHVGEIFSIPSLEWLKKLKSIALGVDNHLEFGCILWRWLVCVLSSIESSNWKLLTMWILQEELLAVLNDLYK